MNYNYLVLLYFIAFCLNWHKVYSKSSSYIEWCEDAGERRRVDMTRCRTFSFVYPYPVCYCLNGIASLTTERDGDISYELQFSKHGCFSHKSVGAHNRTLEMLAFDYEDTETLVGILDRNMKWNLLRVPQSDPINSNGTVVVYNGQVIDTGEDYENGPLYCIQKNIDPNLQSLVRHYQLQENSWIFLNNTCDGGNYVDDLDLVSSTNVTTPENQACSPICPPYSKRPSDTRARPPDEIQLNITNNDNTDLNQRKDCVPIPQELKARHLDLNNRILKFSIERAFHDQQNVKKVYEPVRSFRILELLAKITTKYCKHAKIPTNFLDQAISYFKVAHEGQTGFQFSEFFSHENLFVIQRMLRRCLWSLEPPFYTSTGCHTPEILTAYANESNPLDKKVIKPTANHQYFDHHIVLDIPWNMLDLANTVCVKGFSGSYRMYHEMEQGIEKLITPQLRQFWLYPDISNYYYEHIFGPHWMTLARNLEKCVQTAYMYQPNMARLHRPAWISGLRQSTRHRGTIVDPICTRRRIDIPLVSDNYEIYCENLQGGNSDDDRKTTTTTTEGPVDNDKKDTYLDWPPKNRTDGEKDDTFLDWPKNKSKDDSKEIDTYLNWPKNKKDNDFQEVTTYLNWPKDKSVARRKALEEDNTQSESRLPRKKKNVLDSSWDSPQSDSHNDNLRQPLDATKKSSEDEDTHLDWKGKNSDSEPEVFIQWPKKIEPPRPKDSEEDILLDWSKKKNPSPSPPPPPGPPSSDEKDIYLDWRPSDSERPQVFLEWPKKKNSPSPSPSHPPPPGPPNSDEKDAYLDWKRKTQTEKPKPEKDDVVIDFPSQRSSASEEKITYLGWPPKGLSSTRSPIDSSKEIVYLTWPKKGVISPSPSPPPIRIDWPPTDKEKESRETTAEVVINWPTTRKVDDGNKPSNLIFFDWPKETGKSEPPPPFVSTTPSSRTERPPQPNRILIDFPIQSGPPPSPQTERPKPPPIDHPTFIDWPENPVTSKENLIRIDFPDNKVPPPKGRPIIIDWPDNPSPPSPRTERPPKPNHILIDFPIKKEPPPSPQTERPPKPNHILIDFPTKSEPPPPPPKRNQILLDFPSNNVEPPPNDETITIDWPDKDNPRENRARIAFPLDSESLKINSHIDMPFNSQPITGEDDVVKQGSISWPEETVSIGGSDHSRTSVNPNQETDNKRQTYLNFLKDHESVGSTKNPSRQQSPIDFTKHLDPVLDYEDFGFPSSGRQSSLKREIVSESPMYLDEKDLDKFNENRGFGPIYGFEKESIPEQNLYDDNEVDLGSNIFLQDMPEETANDVLGPVPRFIRQGNAVHSGQQPPRINEKTRKKRKYSASAGQSPQGLRMTTPMNPSSSSPRKKQTLVIPVASTIIKKPSLKSQRTIICPQSGRFEGVTGSNDCRQFYTCVHNEQDPTQVLLVTLQCDNPDTHFSSTGQRCAPGPGSCATPSAPGILQQSQTNNNNI